MVTRFLRTFVILPVLVLSVLTAPSRPASRAASQHGHQVQSGSMPDGLMSAFLAASSEPFAPQADGYHAHSGGLDVTLDTSGLQTNLGGLTWRLALRGLGRGKQTTALPQAEIVQTHDRLEYRRGVLTEWYRDTAMGIEQGFTVHEPPLGTRPLVLHLDLSTDLIGKEDIDTRGLSFATPEGQTLRYDQLRAWDAYGAPLEAHLSYLSGQVTVHIDDHEAIYPVTIDPLIYVEQRVTASDGAPSDDFGWAVALFGNTALVGAPNDDVGTNSDQGSAYIFVRSGTTWSEQAHLTALDGAANDHFGCSVALWGDTALVGAHGDSLGELPWQWHGSAYVFTGSGTTWGQQAKLVASDAWAGDLFGSSVALWGDAALLGAPGGNSAYVFVRSETTWSEEQELTPLVGYGDTTSFGGSVALWNDTALVGSPYEGTTGWGQGSAYAFTQNGTAWSVQARLTASDSRPSDFFGRSVALWGDTILVGSPTDYGQGAAYVFSRSGTTWSQQDKLTVSDSTWEDEFAYSVALWGDTALVGARRDDVGTNSDQGSAHVFTRNGTTWSEQAHLTASDGAPGDWFGYSVALWGDTALVGAHYNDVGAGWGQGSAYLYDAFPRVEALARIDRSPTDASSVRFAATFSEDVTGVDVSDFATSTTGSVSGATVTAIDGTGATYTITVSTGTGSGALRLDVPSSATITDSTGNPLSGLPYTGGEAYMVRLRMTYLPLVLRDVP